MRRRLPTTGLGVNPLYYPLAPGRQLLRIYSTSHRTTATSFRHWGPLERFDHHRAVTKTHRVGPADDPDRAVYYCAFTLSSCIAEVFGDLRRIETTDRWLASVTLSRPLNLLDLRGNGAMRAGTIAAIAKDPARRFSQAWARWFYEQASLYGTIDGLIYLNAHNDAESVMLNDRAEGALIGNPGETIELSDRALTTELDYLAIDLNLGR